MLPVYFNAENSIKKKSDLFKMTVVFPTLQEGRVETCNTSQVPGMCQVLRCWGLSRHFLMCDIPLDDKYYYLHVTNEKQWTQKGDVNLKVILRIITSNRYLIYGIVCCFLLHSTLSLVIAQGENLRLLGFF